MKATIQDRSVLAGLRPLELVAYLRSTGWTQAALVQNRWATWVKGDAFEVALPLNRELGDFVLRMADALKTLSAAEERSQLEVLNDLLTTSADVIRLRVTDADSADGTIPLKDGAQIVKHASDLMMAGACAAIEHRPVFRGRKPNQAVEYLNRVRMGQTERGSFVVTMISRVAPVLAGAGLDHFNEPFERKTTSTLATALNAVRLAAESAAASGSFDDFQAAIAQGVSADLCDALHGMVSGGETERGLEIGFSWSRSRPLGRATIPHRISFTPDTMPVIEEAARLFRETAPREEFEVRGPVVRLDRPEGSPTGKATILSFVDERARKVVVELGDADYHRAVEAHDQRKVVSCLGLLVPQVPSFVLENARAFTIEADE